MVISKTHRQTKKIQSLHECQIIKNSSDNNNSNNNTKIQDTFKAVKSPTQNLALKFAGSSGCMGAKSVCMWSSQYSTVGIYIIIEVYSTTTLFHSRGDLSHWPLLSFEPLKLGVQEILWLPDVYIYYSVRRGDTQYL